MLFKGNIVIFHNQLNVNSSNKFQLEVNLELLTKSAFIPVSNYQNDHKTESFI